MREPSVSWQKGHGDERDGLGCGGVVMAPAGKTPKTKGGRTQVEGVHGVIPDREKVVRGDVNKDTMQIRYQAESL